jgi:hypothetical protein
MMLRGIGAKVAGLNRTYLSTREKGTTPPSKQVWTTAADSRAETTHRALSGGEDPARSAHDPSATRLRLKSA